MVSQTRSPKAWRNLPSFAHNPKRVFCFALYSIKLRKLFPPRKGAVRNLAAASLGCVRIFFFPWRNNAAREVYCLRARDRIASAARRRSDLLPYLGPEIIAVIQAAPNFAPNDSRTGASPAVWAAPRHGHSPCGLLFQSEVLRFKNGGCPQRLGHLG